jgi:tetratricopeptide (TPR) repeat protein
MNQLAPSQPTPTKFTWFPVSDQVKQLLQLAIDHWDDSEQSLAYMNQALAIAPNNPDVLIAAYRYFFYKNDPQRALKVATIVIDQVRQAEQLPEQWEDLKLILSDRKEEPNIRLFINAYAASGFVLAKLGELEQAKEITARVKEIDDKRESCAGTIFEVLTNPIEEEDE